MENTLRRINSVYYTIYMLTIISAVAVFMSTYMNLNTFLIDSNSVLATTLSSVLIIYILITIPLSMWLFHKKTISLQQIADKYAKYNNYRKAAILRLWIIGIGLIAGVALFYILSSQSMIFCALISAVALFFCKPSVGKMMKELNLDEDEI